VIAINTVIAINIVIAVNIVIAINIMHSARRSLHVAVAPEGLETAAVLAILRAAGALRDVRTFARTQFHDDFGRRARVRLNAPRARIAAERTIP
jgi:hypothetical protein